nr:hypothetical protein [Tanacetum cinerariifolium]
APSIMTNKPPKASVLPASSSSSLNGKNDGSTSNIHLSNPYDVLDEESEEEFENVFVESGNVLSEKTGIFSSTYTVFDAAATSGQPRRSVRPNQNVVTFVNVGALNEGILAHVPDKNLIFGSEHVQADNDDGHYTDRANDVTGDKSNATHVENEITASQDPTKCVFKASQNDDLVIDSLNNTMADGGIEWTEVSGPDVVAIFGISITSRKDIDILTTRIEAGECDDVLDGLSKDERKAVMDAIMTLCEKYLAASNGGANDGTDGIISCGEAPIVK